MAVQPRGEVYDIGYRHYEGPREGRNRARFALWTNGVRTALGLGRGTRAKVLPILLFASTMVPAAIFVIMASLAEDFGVSDVVEVPGHADYYDVVSILVLMFSAIIAPELLCADRRSQVLQLYLVRPLTPTDYVAGRWLAFFTIVLALVYSGQVVMFVGFTFAAEEPLEYVRANWLDVPRFLAAGAVVAVFVTTIPLAVSGFTARRAYAAGFVIGLFIISAAAANSLTTCTGGDVTVRTEDGVTTVSGCEPVTGQWAKWIGLTDFGSAPSHINGMIFDEVSDSDAARQVSELNDAIPIAWFILLTVGPAAILLRRYQKAAL